MPTIFLLQKCHGPNKFYGWSDRQESIFPSIQSNKSFHGRGVFNQLLTATTWSLSYVAGYIIQKVLLYNSGWKLPLFIWCCHDSSSVNIHHGPSRGGLYLLASHFCYHCNKKSWWWDWYIYNAGAFFHLKSLDDFYFLLCRKNIWFNFADELKIDVKRCRLLC